MKASNEKLKSILMEAMELDNARLEEEMKHCEPHVFSAEFEKSMEELFRVQRRKSKLQSALRYIAAAVLVILLTGGILFIGSEDLHASELSIDILEWLDEFFTVQDGIDDRSDSGAIFDESQIGYLPEGFEKVSENVTFSLVQYEFENDVDDRISLHVARNKMNFYTDNQGIERDILINEKGYEYTLIVKDNFKSIVWKDNNEIYYYLLGDVELGELINIMNGISY